MEAMDELVQLAESMCQATSLLLGDDDPSDESNPCRPSTFLNAVALGNVQRSRPPSASPRAPTALDAIDKAVGKLKSVLDEEALRAEELMAPLESHCSGRRRRRLQWDSVQEVMDEAPPRLPPPRRRPPRRPPPHPPR
uniref:Uncharacterized protein n=1 Tax=Oryza glumipatula TaxID=40148 RepID=A0A0D9Y9W5_9ORYZ